MKSVSRHPDWLIAILFWLAALAIRLPEFTQIPRMSDEGQEALWALDITQGKHLPLTGITPQLGPFFPYLLAMVFALFGPQVFFPRLFTTVLSALIVPLTYVLGHATRDRAVGIVAALFVLTCPDLIVYGHFGWSASLPPFFAVAGFAALTVGFFEGKSGWLATSGLLLALSVQGHATSAVLLVGIVLWFFRLPNWRGLTSSREVIIALGLFVLGCAPQLITWIGIIFHPPAEGISGMLAPALSPAVYFERLIPFVRIGGFFLGGGIGEATFPLRVKAIVVELLFLGGLLWMVRAKLRLIPLVLVSSILLLPALISEPNERYYLYLFPLAYIPVATIVVGIWTTVGDARGRWVSANPVVRGVIRLGVIALVALLVMTPVANLAAYFADITAQERTNQEYYRVAGVVREHGACRPALLIEDAPPDFSSPAPIQFWFSLHTIDFLLTFDRCEHALAKTGFDRAEWLIISESTAARLAADEYEEVAEFSPPPIESRSVKIFLLRALR